MDSLHKMEKKNSKNFFVSRQSNRNTEFCYFFFFSSLFVSLFIYLFYDGGCKCGMNADKARKLWFLSHFPKILILNILWISTQIHWNKGWSFKLDFINI